MVMVLGGANQFWEAKNLQLDASKYQPKSSRESRAPSYMSIESPPLAKLNPPDCAAPLVPKPKVPLAPVG